MPSSMNVVGVAIENGGFTDEGFITPFRLESYFPSMTPTPENLTPEIANATRAGNLRYRDMIAELQTVTNAYILPETIVADGADGISEATSLAFQFIVPYGVDSVITPD